MEPPKIAPKIRASIIPIFQIKTTVPLNTQKLLNMYFKTSNIPISSLLRFPTGKNSPIGIFCFRQGSDRLLLSSVERLRSIEEQGIEPCQRSHAITFQACTLYSAKSYLFPVIPLLSIQTTHHRLFAVHQAILSSKILSIFCLQGLYRGISSTIYIIP